jgi:O-acetyl-ADP-ribose deacetylase (regulator of RNase III)
MTLTDRLAARQGDITTLAVDAIVNAANTTLLGGGGVDGAIHRAAGPQLLAECRSMGGCPVGEARLTRGHGLPAGHVIHTVGPIYRGRPEDRRLLTACYTSSLTLARDNALRTLAFPAISCGAYGYPIGEACRIAVDTCARFMADSDIPATVTFMLFSKADLAVYQHYLTLKSGLMGA